MYLNGSIPTRLQKPDYISDKDWEVVCRYADRHKIHPALIAAVGWAETRWGQKGIGRDGILGYGVFGQADTMATFRGFDNQIYYGSAMLGRFFSGRTITYDSLLEFARSIWKPKDPELWARNVYSAYQHAITSHTRQDTGLSPRGAIDPGALPRGLQLGEQIDQVPSWFDPVRKSFFTRRLEPDREDSHSPIDPTEFSYEQIINMMHYNQVQYSCRGRLIQAFPTFLMMFIDEGEWAGGRRLWDNFYFYHSVVGIDIIKERNNPADVAKIELTNVYGALNHYTVPPRLEKLGIVQRLFPGITKHSLEMRKQLLHDLMVRPGTRIHVRMGYGSSVSRLPILFNGIITEIDTQDLAVFVAQGDGHELLNEMTQYGPDDKTGSFKLGHEPTDIIREIMCKRGLGFHFHSPLLSSLLTRFNKDYVHTDLDKDYAFGVASPFGIEHFGTVRKDQTQLVSLGKSLKTWDVMTNVYPLTINIGRVNRLWHETIQESQTRTKEESEKWWSSLKAWLEGTIGSVDDYLSELKTAIWKEPNIGIWLGQKTPWDVFGLISRCTKGYVRAVFPFQFRSSLFHGLPWWPVCIKYTNRSHVGIEQYFTTLQQFYYFSSFSDIIYNDIKASSRHIITNAAAIYTLGKGAELAPVVMADHTIRSDLQKTEVVDSGTVQDIKVLPDKALHWFGVQTGEDRAMTYAQSYIVEKLRDMYQGELILRGSPAVKPHDLFFLDDAYTHMYGLAEVGRVVHSISPQHGFITTVKPDLISRHLESAELWGHLYTGLVSAGIWAALHGLRVINLAKTAGLSYLSARVALIGKRAVNAAQAVGGIWKATAAGKLAVTAKAAAVGAAVGSIVPGVGTVVGSVAGSVIVHAGVYGIINATVKFVQKYFATRNTVKIYPMFLQDKVYVAGITGAKYLIAYGPYDNLFYPSEEGSGVAAHRADSAMGEPNQAPLADGRYLAWPSRHKGTITSLFGMRSLGGKTEMHKGIDIAFPKDTDIMAALGGRVTKVGYDDKGYGHYVIVSHGMYETRYAHLQSRPTVTQGQQIRAGTIIGRQGSTGRATGPHLHFELRRTEGAHSVPIDPFPYLPPSMRSARP